MNSRYLPPISKRYIYTSFNDISPQDDIYIYIYIYVKCTPCTMGHSIHTTVLPWLFTLKGGNSRAGWRYGDATSSWKVAAADAAWWDRTSWAGYPPFFAIYINMIIYTRIYSPHDISPGYKLVYKPHLLYNYYSYTVNIISIIQLNY